jgi:curved DNA-binding protein
LDVTIEELARGGVKAVEVSWPDPSARGGIVRKNLKVKLPRGAKEGTVVRLAGQGDASGYGEAGDLLLKLHVAPHPVWRADGYDLIARVGISPWEAALGAQVGAPTLDGEVVVKVPQGTSSGRKLRLRGKGLFNASGERGDLFVELEVRVPKTLTEQERALFEQLASLSTFNPRADS